VRNPITGTAGLCARTAIGQTAAAPPTKANELAPPHLPPPAKDHAKKSIKA